MRNSQHIMGLIAAVPKAGTNKVDHSKGSHTLLINISLRSRIPAPRAQTKTRVILYNNKSRLVFLRIAKQRTNISPYVTIKVAPDPPEKVYARSPINITGATACAAVWVNPR
jgi:hypothetical protein